MSTLFLVVFSVGSRAWFDVLQQTVPRREKDLRKVVPFGCIGMTTATLLLYFQPYGAKTRHLAGVMEFIAGARFMGDHIFFSDACRIGRIQRADVSCSMQSSSDEHRARVIACAPGTMILRNGPFVLSAMLLMLDIP